MLTRAQVKQAGGYKVIYIDPAWEYRGKGGRGAAEHHYDCTDLDWLMSIPIGEIAADDCALFMWATWPFNKESMILGECANWGFEYKTLAFIWFKYRANSCRPHYGNGRFTRANSEPVFLFTKGKPQRDNKGVDQFIETVSSDEDLAMVEWLKQDTKRSVAEYFMRMDDHSKSIDDRLLQAPLWEHSVKPPEIRHRIKRLMGDVPSVEIFGRERVPGWDVCGNDPRIGASDIVDIFPPAGGR